MFAPHPVRVLVTGCNRLPGRAIYHPGMRLRLFSSFLIAVLIAAGCSDDGEPASSPDADAAADDSTDTGDGDTDDDLQPPTAAPASFEVRPGVEQAIVIGADPGASLKIWDNGNDIVAAGTADENGSFIFRRVEPGEGYMIGDASSGPTKLSDPFDVMAIDDHPDQSFFTNQALVEGLNYIETRDGTLLAATVRFPDDAGDGPFPTVVEYSGYDPADPVEEEPTIGIYRQLGYATVGINMRGSGCSGGAYSFFDPSQRTDGYDAIEAVAAQDWVEHGHVGMVGISYSGISQLFVASTQPPSLAAITPISVIEDTYRSTLYPGGIYNNGFAKSWADSRQGSNEAYGQEWVQREVDAGDEVCAANQSLRSQNVDLIEEAALNAYYDPEIGDPISPRTLVDQINVPVFLAGAWQDEQTGGRFATMLDNFTGAPVFKADLYNGAHADSLGPYSLHRAAEFLDVYVARRTPEISPFIRFGAPVLYEQVFGVAGIELPEDRFSSLEDAEATIESEPSIRLFLEMGSADEMIGAPVPRTVVEFDQWPIPASYREELFLGPGGTLGATVAPDTVAEAFTVDVSRSQELTKTADEFPEGESDPNEFDNLAWAPLEEGTALVYDTSPLEADMLVAGSGRVILWVAAELDDADLQATISEVRVDGQEMYVQNGWLRASHRTTVTGDSDPDTFHPHLRADAAPLPAGEFTQVTVEIFPFAHVFRAGSQIRLTIDTPGGTRNLWAFDVPEEADGTDVLIGLGGTTVSMLSLPVIVDGATTTDPGLPVCGGQRSQPCRPAAEWVNRSGGLP